MMNGCGRVLQFGDYRFQTINTCHLGDQWRSRPETITVSRYAGKGTKTKAQEHKTVDRHYLGQKVSMVNEGIRAGYICSLQLSYL